MQILQAAFQYENTQVIELYVDEANHAEENEKATIFKSVMKIDKNALKTAECKRLFKLLVNKVNVYVQENNLIQDQAWQSMLQDFYGAEYQKIVDT